MEELVRKYITLPSRPSAKGWYSIKCQSCNDYKVRGGFKFENGVTSYHCFNCQTKASYDDNRKFLSDEMVTILQSFGIPNSELNQLRFDALGHNYIKHNKPADITQNPLIEIPLPPHFYKLTDDDNDTWSVIAREYLEFDRGIDYKDYPFYLSYGGISKHDKQWPGRLIIPYYRRGRLIFYQGRDLLGTRKIRYKNAVTENNSIILYGYNEIYDNTSTDPLFIVEGFFDAYHIGGVAILGSELSKPKIDVINQSRRRKIYIPDMYGNGIPPALAAIEAGWEVSVPDIGTCKDVNDAVMRFGKLYVIKSILEKAMSGFDATVAVTTLCK